MQPLMPCTRPILMGPCSILGYFSSWGPFLFSIAGIEPTTFGMTPTHYALPTESSSPDINVILSAFRIFFLSRCDVLR